YGSSRRARLARGHQRRTHSRRPSALSDEGRGHGRDRRLALLLLWSRRRNLSDGSSDQSEPRRGPDSPRLHHLQRSCDRPFLLGLGSPSRMIEPPLPPGVIAPHSAPQSTRSARTEPSEPGITLDRVHFSYPGGQKILVDTSWELLQGESAVVTGGVGSGKSTLLYLCAGLLAPVQGKVLLSGFPITPLLPI